MKGHSGGVPQTVHHPILFSHHPTGPRPALYRVAYPPAPATVNLFLPCRLCIYSSNSTLQLVCISLFRLFYYYYLGHMSPSPSQNISKAQTSLLLYPPMVSIPTSQSLY